MLYNVNPILCKMLYTKHLLRELYKHLKYTFYLTGQFVSWNFAKLQKQSLGLRVSPIGTYISVT